MLYQQFINRCEFFIMLLERFVEGEKKAISPALKNLSFPFLNTLVLYSLLFYRLD